MNHPAIILIASLLPLSALASFDPIELPTDVSRVIVLETPEPTPVDADLLDYPAHLVYRITPEYPRELKARGIMGYVEVEIVVDTIGRVCKAEVIKADYPDFAEAALRATREWIFEPALIEGLPVAVKVTVPFRFIIPSLLAQR
ncbi:MAG: energy transducer TonB [Opitutaceae bacterium]